MKSDMIFFFSQGRSGCKPPTFDCMESCCFYSRARGLLVGRDTGHIDFMECGVELWNGKKGTGKSCPVFVMYDR